VTDALKLLAPLAAEGGIRLEAQLADGCVILADADDMYQAVFNLIENALKYNTAQGSVTVLLFRREERVRFIVDDTGVGIPESELPFIFDRFYRVDKARSSAAGGSGLGLSIVRDMVTKHAGSVEASRREHGGTRFELVFPAWKG
jgi:signal transduction histidine kinase